MFAQKFAILKLISAFLVTLLMADMFPHPQLAPGVVSSLLNRLEQPSERGG